MTHNAVAKQQQAQGDRRRMEITYGPLHTFIRRDPVRPENVNEFRPVDSLLLLRICAPQVRER